MATLLIILPHLYPKVDIAAGGWHSTALTDNGEVSTLSLSPQYILYYIIQIHNLREANLHRD